MFPFKSALSGTMFADEPPEILPIPIIKGYGDVYVLFMSSMRHISFEAAVMAFLPFWAAAQCADMPFMLISRRPNAAFYHFGCSHAYFLSRLKNKSYVAGKLVFRFHGKLCQNKRYRHVGIMTAGVHSIWYFR